MGALNSYNLKSNFKHHSLKFNQSFFFLFKHNFFNINISIANLELGAERLKIR